MKLTTTIPFPGFYESELSHMVDYEIESIFDHEGTGSPEIPDAFHFAADYSDIYLAVAKVYLSAFQDFVNEKYGVSISLDWDAMTSPREYNFETDRVFAFVSLEDAQSLLVAVKKEHGETVLDDAAAKRFTSRDGFISSYSPDISDWPADMAEWDHNQIGTIFACVEDSEDFNVSELMENASCNGHLANAVWDNLNDEAKALVPEYKS